MLFLLEEKLKQREMQRAMRPPNMATITCPENYSVQSSPQIFNKDEIISRQIIKKPPLVYQSTKDFVPQNASKDGKGVNGFESQKNMDVYHSNDNFVFQKNNEVIRNQFGSGSKQEEEKKNYNNDSYQPAPLSHRRNSQKDLYEA